MWGILFCPAVFFYSIHSTGFFGSKKIKGLLFSDSKKKQLFCFNTINLIKTNQKNAYENVHNKPL